MLSKCFQNAAIAPPSRRVAGIGRVAQPFQCTSLFTSFEHRSVSVKTPTEHKLTGRLSYLLGVGLATMMQANTSLKEPIGQSRATALCDTCWILVDIVVLIVILFGNILTILAVRLSRRLRSVTSNHLILSLAISDLIVGLAVFYHLFFFLSSSLNNNKTTCLFRFVFLSCGCCASFCNVTTIAVDRYFAIVHPLKYPEYVTKKFVFIIITVNWCSALFISTIPIYWNKYDHSNSCELDTVIPRYYTIAILTPLFLMVWLSIFLLYWRIWKEAKTHAERWKTNGFIDFDSSHWKSIQVVLLILGCFSICWLPYVVVAFVQVINSRSKPSPTVYRLMFSIAMCNSGVNPIIYAWKNPSFRKAFHRLLRLRAPDHNNYNSSFKNYLRKQNELELKEKKERLNHPSFGIGSSATEETRRITAL